VRPIKILGLAAIAALAAMAFVAATASADAFCETSGLHAGECPAGKILVPGKLLKALATNPLLLDASGNILEECGIGHALATVGTSSAPHTGVKFTINSLEWLNCKGQCSTVTSNALPYPGEALALALLAHITSSGTTTLSGCSIFNLKCTYKLPGANGSGLLKIESDLLVAEKVELARTTPCNFEEVFPAKGFWDAKYLTVLHNTEIPVYIAALP